MQYGYRVKTENGGHSIVRTDKESKEIERLTAEFEAKGLKVEVVPSFQDISHKRDMRHIGFAATF